MSRTRRGLRAVAAPAARTLLRAAIYTRKSTDEGLDRDFSSLDNQRERAEAYAASQGWTAVATRYDDGGFSGGNVERPALKRLLADVEAGLVDAIVVYRLDRLSRSLADFVGLHRFLEKHGVALVSVTESINTSTSHGRMIVNVLVSFGQYERELASERTKHKIEGARRRGKWTGGARPLGYNTAGGRLLVNKVEAEVVKAIFQLFTETPSLIAVAAELNRRGWMAKAGRSWNRVTLRRLLSNPLFAGMQKLGTETFRGEHEAIVPKPLWSQVQRLLADNRTTGGGGARNGHEFLLRGLIRCSACGAAMTPGWSRARGRLYRYYRCTHAEKNGAAACPTKTVQADRVEQFIVDQIRRIGADPELQAATFEQCLAQVKAQRRGLRAEGKRLQRDRLAAQAEVARLVGAVSRVTGPAADAIATELARVQEHLATLEARQREVEAEIAGLAAQDVDRDAVARALQDWDELWSVLLTPERERVLRLLVDRIDYGGGELAIQWRLAGFGQLASEVGS